VDRAAAEQLAKRLYRALATGDRDELDELLHPGFVGRTTEGLPLGLGGHYQGPDAMRREFWGRIGASFVARAEPVEFGSLDDGRLLVRGRYRGRTRDGVAALDAEFVHLLSFADGRIRELVQLTDSARWREVLDRPASETVRFTVDDGLGEFRIDRAAVRNALNQQVADELYEAAVRCAADQDVRAVLISGAGPAFTVGGDLEEIGACAPDDLPSALRRMITPYHEALRILSQIRAPIVTAAHGAVAGGGLGLVCIADLAFAAEGTKFATGFGALGLSGDGGSSWFLPRLIGVRRAAQMYFEQRVLDARQAADWGLVTHVVAEDELEDRARAAARRLADGPTAAYAEMRRLLSGSWSATLPEQLAAETEAITRTAATADAQEGVAAFRTRSTPTFRGR
jgi:2-(1,2-epoxy-1,2-dihydrophenyl)acetyl-CoA isomerase